MIHQPAWTVVTGVSRKLWRHEYYWWVEQKPRCSVRVTEKDAFADLTCRQINNPTSTHARTHARTPTLHTMIDSAKVRFDGRLTVGRGRAGMWCRWRGGGLSDLGRRGSGGPSSSSSHSSPGWRVVNGGAGAAEALKHQGKPSSLVSSHMNTENTPGSSLLPH